MSPRPVTFVVLACLLAPGLAQDEAPADDPVVWFDEETSIADGLKRVDASVEKGDTKGSAIWMQKLLNEHAAKVMEAPDGGYLPAWRVLSRRVAALPKDHLDSYLALYAAEARTKVAAALIERDLAALSVVARSWFPALDDDDLLRVARALSEGGHHGVAEALLEERVLARPRSPLAVVLLASLYARRGDPRALEALRAALPSEGLATPVSLSAASTTPGEVIDRALRSLATEPRTEPPLREPADVPAWSRPVPVLGELYDDYLRMVNNWAGGRLLDASMPGARTLFPVEAAITEDLLLVHLGKSLFAYRLEDGSLAWTRGGERNLAEFYLARTEPTLCRRYGLVVDGRRVYATFEGRPQETGERNDLVCLSLADGKVVWKLDGGNEGKACSFVGIPHVAGDRVYIGATGMEKKEQLLISCLDAAAGTVLWTNEVASRTPPPEEAWYFCPEPVPLVARRHGVVYACTGTGGLAALDASTGQFLWGLKYPCQVWNGNSWIDLTQEHCLLLPPNPILPADEGLWLAPSDAPRFYLIDTVARRILDDHRKDALERYRFLVGTTPRGLVLGGPEVGLYAPREGLLRHWTLPRREGSGRPALDGGRLVVPRGREVVAIDVETFAPVWRRPIEPEASGDVLVTGRGLAIVSPRRVTFFPWK